MEPEVRHLTADEVCATWGPLVVRICDGRRTELEDLQRVEAIFDELLTRHRHVGILLVFHHGTPMPAGPTQRYAMDSTRRFGERLVMSAALLGLGFWADATRATLSTLLRLVGATLSIESSVEQAVARLTLDFVGIDPDALMTVYRDLWQQLQTEQANQAQAS